MDGDAVTARTRLTPNKQRISDSSEGISIMLWKLPNFADQLCRSLQGPGRKMQSRLARGQPRMRDTVTTRPRPTRGGRCSHDSSETNLGWETVTTRSRTTPSGRHNHDSPEADLGWEIQS